MAISLAYGVFLGTIFILIFFRRDLLLFFALNLFILFLLFDDFNFDLFIYNLNGKLIERMDRLKYTSIIDLSGKAAGIYLVRARSGNWTKTIKILKE